MLTPDTLRKGSKTELIRYAKKEYNKRIERVKKAEEYFKNATIEEIEKNEGTLLLILRELSAIGNEIERLTGEKIDSDVAVNGFKGA
ncbi:hypothetical protein [Clostridium butyricum]|uniref:Uncharacterized protein n=1 Tax=Clostridium butyricum TaxID=1492 RepID=A0A2S7FD13_CLOBU|nr:hypothetical protein [Clostridium butyricum]KHD16013.1 hypothetical protein OA81_07005 [Clostridium butyricum]PPV16557.1 hypothetical protein AWN73_09820 [Clostridium butyricum]